MDDRAENFVRALAKGSDEDYEEFLSDAGYWAQEYNHAYDSLSSVEEVEEARRKAERERDEARAEAKRWRDEAFAHDRREDLEVAVKALEEDVQRLKGLLVQVHPPHPQPEICPACVVLGRTP